MNEYYVVLVVDIEIAGVYFLYLELIFDVI